MLSIGHTSWNQRTRWSILGVSVVYGNIPCGRGFTKLPGASVVAKSKNSDGRSTPVECISGPCEGWSLFWDGSTSKWRPLRYSLWIRVSTRPQCWQLFVVLSCILASLSLVGMRSWITINQAALSSSDDHTACKFPHTLDHGVVRCCVIIPTSRDPFNAYAKLGSEA